MHTQFELTGDLTDLLSYPVWLQDVIGMVGESKARVRSHALFSAMHDGELSKTQTRAFFVNGWAVVNQFPQYMSMNLLKADSYGSRGKEKARRFLIRNIRVEQNHVDYWIDWAAESDVPLHLLLEGDGPPNAFALSHWCWKSSNCDSLAASIAATNYAIEGVTGEWSADLCKSGRYELNFDESARYRAMRWLRLHASYDDRHPWEALDIVATLLGASPSAKEVKEVKDSIARSFCYLEMSLDCCLQA